MPHAIGRLDVAGRDLTLHLATLLRESGVVMNSSAEMEIVRWARGGGPGIGELVGVVEIRDGQEQRASRVRNEGGWGWRS